MAQIALYFFVWSFAILVMQALLPDEASKRVKATLKMIIPVLPFRAIINAMKNRK